MSARNYNDRLFTTRAVWSVIVFIVWAGYVAEMGFGEDFWSVTIILAIGWALGWPRNAAKSIARRAQRLQDINDAVEEEINK